MWVEFALLAALLAASGFFSGSETAYFSLDRARLGSLAHRGRLWAMAAALADDLHGLLLVILFGNMVVNVSFFAISFAVAGAWTGGGVWAGAIGLPALILFGEVLPKLLAARAPERVARGFALPLFLFSRLVRPVTALIERLPMARELTHAEQSVTREELKTLVRIAQQAGEIDAAERDLIHEVVEFGEIRVKEVMVPRVDMVGMELPGTKEGALSLIRRTGVTKIVAWEETRDHILGSIDGKDLLLSDETDLRQLVRPVPVVPETKRVEELLREFITEEKRFAVVVDEYGGTEGVVGLEHLLEEIVGEIEEEGRPAQEPAVEEVAPGKALVRGNLSIRDLEERFNVQVDAPGLGTVGGLLSMLLGRLPREGDAVRYEDLLLTVKAVEHRRVTKVLIEQRGKE